MGQHGGQPGAVAAGILVKLLMDLWLHNPPGISLPLALILLHRCARPGPGAGAVQATRLPAESGNTTQGALRACRQRSAPQAALKAP